MRKENSSKSPEPNMTKRQQEYLERELNRMCSWDGDVTRERKEDKKPAKPAVVAAWERKIAQWHNRQRKLKQDYSQRFQADRNAVTKEIHFGTSASALKALEAFRKKYAK